MIAARCPTSYPPPPASQPAIEGAQSVGRPWVTLRRAQSRSPENQKHASRRDKNLTRGHRSE